MGYLGDKPRILVTHQLQYLTGADNIIALSEVSICGIWNIGIKSLDKITPFAQCIF